MNKSTNTVDFLYNIQNGSTPVNDDVASHIQKLQVQQNNWLPESFGPSKTTAYSAEGLKGHFVLLSHHKMGQLNSRCCSLVLYTKHFQNVTLHKVEKYMEQTKIQLYLLC